MFLSDFRNLAAGADAFTLAVPPVAADPGEAESLQRMAGTLAHDFNNLLAVVMSATEQLSGGLAEGSQARELAMVGLQAAERSAQMLARLVALSEQRVEAAASLHAGEVLSSAMRFVRHVAPAAVDVTAEFASGEALVRVDRLALENALLNLCINAGDAMPGGGRLRLAVELREVDAADAPTLEVDPGAYVAFTVADTGEGMAPHILARATQPYFTTKGARGTGLGLSSVKDFVQAAGGGLSIASRIGEGTTVSLLLPVAFPLV
jgi:signal transduction histidine kinase